MPRLSLLLIAVLALTACERSADVARPKVFEQDGLYFQYPGNWSVAENQTAGAMRIISVEAPGDALVILTTYPGSEPVSLNAYADAFSKGLGEAVPFKLLRTQAATGTEDKLDIAFSIGIASMTVPHTANLTLHSLPRSSVICLTQVADEDRHYVQPGFDLMRRTLRASNVKATSTF